MNTKKTLKLSLAGTAAAAALSATILTGPQSVKADTVTAKPNNDAKSETATQTPAQKAQTADANYNAAKANADKAVMNESTAESAKNVADQKKAEADKAVASAQADVDKAQKDVDSVNNGGLDKAKQDLTNKQNAVKNAEENATQKTTDVSHAQKNATAAQAEYDKAKSADDSAKQAVSTAQSDLDKANDAYHNTNLAKAQKDSADADSNVAKADSAVKTATTDKTNADSAVKDAQAKLDIANSAKAKADQDVKTKTGEENSKKLDLDKANTAVTNAKNDKAIAQANNDKVADTDKITISDEYKNAMTKLDHDYWNKVHYFNDHSDEPGIEKRTDIDSDYNKIVEGIAKDNPTVKKLHDISAKLYKENTYKGSSADHNIIVDLANMTDAQRLEVNKYALTLINDVQRQMGRPEYILNNGMIKLAQAVGDQYTEDHWSGEEKGHDMNAIGSDKSLTYTKYGISGVAENMSDDFFGYSAIGDDMSDQGGQYIGVSDDQNRLNLPDGQLTMYDLKGAIYNGLRAMYFNSREWGHATNFLAMVMPNQDDFTKHYYMGVGFSQVGNGSNEYDIHYNIITDNEINWSNGKFVPGTVVNTDGTKDQQAAQEALTNATKALDEAEAAQIKAQNDYDNAHQALLTALDTQKTAASNQTAAQTALTTAENKQTTAKNTLDKANADLASAKAAQTKAHETLANYTASQADKLNAIKTAQSKLDKAIQAETKTADTLKIKTDALNKANEAVKTAQNNLTKANQQVAAAQQAVKSVQAEIRTLTNAPQHLAKAQAELESAKKAQINAAAMQKQAQDSLTKATNALSNAQADLIKATKAKQEADDELAKFNMQNETDNYFNSILDSTQAKLDQTKHEDEKPIASDVKTTSTKHVKTIKFTLKRGKLYIGKKRATAKQIRVLLKRKNTKLVVSGTCRHAKRVVAYNIHGKKLSKKINLLKSHKILGFKVINHHLMVKLAKNVYIKYADLF